MLRKELDLRYQQCGRQQLLLTARNAILHRETVEPKGEFGTLRTHLGRTEFLIVGPATVQGFTQGEVGIPAYAITEAKLHPEQYFAQRLCFAHQLRDIA